jgi:RecQ family ATP-dependent DNA helicase
LERRVTTGGIDDRLGAILSQTFGIGGFRPGQQEAVETILAGRDLLALMPTGAGKSLCFQLPALARGGLTLVISPLIALMKDQVDGLQALGVPAGMLASGQTAEERRAVWRALRAGRLRLLYVSPERLREQSFAQALAELEVWLVAVDEAHCVSSWGIDFRPDYLRIAETISRLPYRPVVAAFTATATPQVRVDLVAKLDLDDPVQVLAGFDRPNLRFLVQFCQSPGARLTALAREVAARRGSGIVYAGTRKAAEEQADWLRQQGRRASAYHAGLNPDERSAVQDAFMGGAIDVVCATNAFGLGIDKPDVRFVIHTTLPPSPDAYYQEAGRAGRDGLPSDALLLYSRSDRQLQEWLIDRDVPSLRDLLQLHAAVSRGDGAVDLELLGKRLDLSATTLRVGLQALADGGLIELGERAGGNQSAATAVEQVDRERQRRLETLLARQREWRMRQLDATVDYAEGYRCRRTTLLHYFGDLAAEPRGDAGCCDRCASPEQRSAGEAARLSQARRLLRPKRLSAARAQLRDALVELGNVPAVARRLGLEPPEVGNAARRLVSEGHLPVAALVPAEVQDSLDEARQRMDAEGIDYRRPRPGYLQTAMRFCPPGTNWDHLAIYLAGLRRQETLEQLGQVDESEVTAGEAEDRPRRAVPDGAGASWEASLEMFRAGQPVERIAAERGLKTTTVEGHLAKAVEVGKLELAELVDAATAEIIRRAIAETPPSETPLRDIRERAQQLAGRSIPYLAINAVRAVSSIEQPAPPGPGAIDELRQRRGRAERLRADYAAAGKPWPARWEAEYQEILRRISELEPLATGG